MKATLSIAISLLMAFFSFAQNETQISQSNISEIKVTPPEFSDHIVTNEKSLIGNYMMENFRTPENNNAQGTEVVQFTVTSKGKVTDFKVINSVSHAIDQEMIRVLKTTIGMWKPGYNNNNPVDMTKEVSMIFYIEKELKKPTVELFKEWAAVSFRKGNKALFENQNTNKALRFFNEGINYLPYDKSLLLLRGVCRYELGDREGAMEDWNRMSGLGETIDMSEYAALLQGMKGYDELMAVMKK